MVSGNRAGNRKECVPPTSLGWLLALPPLQHSSGSYLRYSIYLAIGSASSGGAGGTATAERAEAVEGEDVTVIGGELTVQTPRPWRERVELPGLAKAPGGGAGGEGRATADAGGAREATATV